LSGEGRSDKRSRTVDDLVHAIALSNTVKRFENSGKRAIVLATECFISAPECAICAPGCLIFAPE
jgi:hypothetical protein